MDHVNGIGALSRRSFLGGAIGSPFIFALAPVFAETTKLEVGAVTIQFVVDNATFGPFLRDLTLPGLKVVRNTGDKGKARMAPRALSGEFGRSLLATSRRGGKSAVVLVDFGYAPETVRNNLTLLGSIPPRSTRMF
ncbi:hypothetical protein [Sphingobium yanoikuyae]|uniref:hypothetical protein n=1 Tax=Sphingobium yanoikuyae TaxID=13690 RepID=UPI00345E0D38